LRAIAVDHTAPALLPIGAGGDMGDKWNSDRDEPVTGSANDEQIRGVATDEDDFDAEEELDEDELEDEEGSSTF
jgi:hypothetical protein